MKGHLPIIDYEAYQPGAFDFSDSLEKCPMESLVWVGQPSQKDLEATLDDELPDRIEADFQTTVDRADWRG